MSEAELSEKTRKSDEPSFEFDWRFYRYYKTVGYLAEVNTKRKEVTVFLPRKNVTFIADISSYVNPEKLKAGHVYDMTFAIYHAKVDPKLMQILAEKIKEPYVSDTSRYRREYNLYGFRYLEQTLAQLDTVYRFELLKASALFYLPETEAAVRQQFAYDVQQAYRVPTKFKWRHLLGY